MKLNLWLGGKVVPKARPRVTRNGTYMPPKYREWRQEAERELLNQIPTSMSVPISEPIEVVVELWGKHRTTIDVDNASGSVLDALVGAGILNNDSLKFVPKLIVEYLPNLKDLGVAVIIKSRSLKPSSVLHYLG